MSGRRMTITFLKTAPPAKICSPTTQIQTLVRLKHSKLPFVLSALKTEACCAIWEVAGRRSKS